MLGKGHFDLSYCPLSLESSSCPPPGTRAPSWEKKSLDNRTLTDCVFPIRRHIEVNPEKNGNLFFWHFQNQHIANKQRTVIWLNGGPGCSSEDGALMEIGPYRVKDEKTLVYNQGSWGEFANLLFVDNPVGTGFSFVNTDSFVHELTEMADQFVTFLEKYFAIFPEYEHDDVGLESV